MDVVILNTNFEVVHIIDDYKSFIWTERYSDCGDFELYVPITEVNIERLREDYYVTIQESDYVMIIEDIEISKDDNGDRLLCVTGRSLESILARRIVWSQTTFKDVEIYEIIKSLINDAIIEPTSYERKIDNFIVRPLYTIDRIPQPPEIGPGGILIPKPDILTEIPDDYNLYDHIRYNKLGEIQFTGDNLYDVIKSICDANDLGFRIILNEYNEFEFFLCYGIDRSYGTDDNPQTSNSYVVFSPSFDNLLSSSYLKSVRNLKNVALVAGEGEGTSRKTATVISSTSVVYRYIEDSNGESIYDSNGDIINATGGAGGINRRELYVDARDISSKTGGGIIYFADAVTNDDYDGKLKQRGNDKLTEYATIESFDGEVDYSLLYKYGSIEDIKNGNAHYSMGDIVQLENEYGIKSRSRVVEVIRSDGESGYNLYPTFKKI